MAISLIHQPGPIDRPSSGNDEGTDHYKVLVRTTEGSDRLIIPTDSLPPQNFFFRLLTCRCTARSARATYCPKRVISKGLSEKYPSIWGSSAAVAKLEKSLVEAKMPNLANDLLAMEERQVSIH